MWYRTGFKEADLKVGDSVEFVPTSDKWGLNVNPADIKLLTWEFPASTPSALKSYTAKGFPIAPLEGQRAIVRQNSLSNAREVVMQLVERAAVDAFTDDALATRIIRLASMFEAYSCGDNETATLAGEAK
jgi:hypothetical protein